MVTFTIAPCELLSHAPSAAAQQATSSACRARSSARLTLLRSESKRMLQEYRGGERVDVALAPARRSAQLAHRAQRGRGSVPLVDQPHRKTRPLFQLRRDLA